MTTGDVIKKFLPETVIGVANCKRGYPYKLGINDDPEQRIMFSSIPNFVRLYRYEKYDPDIEVCLMKICDDSNVVIKDQNGMNGCFGCITPVYYFTNKIEVMEITKLGTILSPTEHKMFSETSSLLGIY